MSRKVVVAIYSHPEDYPPTLSALTPLSAMFERVTVLHRPHHESRWIYPQNVQLLPSGQEVSAEGQTAAPLAKRYGWFARYVLDLGRLLRTEQPALVLLYDPLALLAYSFAKSRSSTPSVVWYHNHDALDHRYIKPLSLAWFARYAQARLFPHLNLFTLPALERSAHFPMDKLGGKFVFLPNWPPRGLFSPRRNSATGDEPRPLRLVFQGRIDENHGIETMVKALPLFVGGRPVRVVLAGFVEPTFASRILDIVKSRRLEEHVTILGHISYSELPAVTASCDVGIGVYMKTDVMNSTIGTASNKLYEYAAAGLPVIYYDNEHFRKHLAKYAWTVPWNGSAEDFEPCVQRIVASYDAMSAAARADHLSSLNYESHFEQVSEYLTLNCQ